MTEPTGPAGMSSDADLQPSFEVCPGSEQHAATVRAAGDIDLMSAGQLQAALTEAAGTASEITADMTAVTYCDSAGIRVLFTTARSSRLTVILPASGPITTMVRLAGLDQVATVVIQ